MWSHAGTDFRMVARRIAAYCGPSSDVDGSTKATVAGGGRLPSESCVDSDT